MPIEPSERITIIPIVKREEKAPINQGKRNKQQKREKDKGKDRDKKIDIRV